MDDRYILFSVLYFKIFVIIKNTKPTVLVQSSLKGCFYIIRIELNIAIYEGKKSLKTEFLSDK